LNLYPSIFKEIAYPVKVGIDIDGVVVDGISVMRHRLKEYIGCAPFDELPRTFYFNPPGVEESVLLDSINRMLIDYDHEIMPYDGAIDALHQIARITGDHPFFVTSREGQDLRSITAKWLLRHLSIPFRIVHRVRKAELLRELEFDVLIEDRLKTVNEIDFLQCILINRPWNEGRAIGSHVVRVKDLGEAAKVLKDMELSKVA